MTKKIRVENADTSTYKVRAYYEDRQADGTREHVEPSLLDYPTSLSELYITSTRRVVVEEV